MTPAHLVDELIATGSQIRVVGDRLRITAGPNGLTAAQADALRQHKPDIIAILRETTPQTDADVDDVWAARLQAWVVACAERIVAEICDHCGRRNCTEHEG